MQRVKIVAKGHILAANQFLKHSTGQHLWDSPEAPGVPPGPAKLGLLFAKLQKEIGLVDAIFFILNFSPLVFSSF